MWIEDYALIGDLQTAALVSRAGSIDWLCLPRFDSPACFCALLGKEENGRWKIAPKGEFRTERRYQPESLILETDFISNDAHVRIVDFMPVRVDFPDVVRQVACLRGRARIELDLCLRTDFGSRTPSLSRHPDGVLALVGPDGFRLEIHTECELADGSVRSEFELQSGETKSFVLSWFESRADPPKRMSAPAARAETENFWRRWTSGCRYDGPYREAVLRSCITLKALTFAPTGGIVAAPTTSLPETIGGSRNWDYRYCWIRDASFTLNSLLIGGFEAEAREWQRWLLRAVGGEPGKMQILYGLSGESLVFEHEIPWLAGYAGSRPVRMGNAARGQAQLDIYGELIDVLATARERLDPRRVCDWPVQVAMLDHLERVWREPDEGIWETRSGKQQFTHSKVMSWVAFDRAVRIAERFREPAPLERWRRTRDRIHEEVCRRGFHPGAGAFVQHFDADALDASLLRIPLVGFLPADDPRMRSTAAAIERTLGDGECVRRYLPHSDGLDGEEGVFLACSFWLVDNYTLRGEIAEARRRFEQLLKLRNDVGLLSEEFDPKHRRLLGNFPQAFSHVALVNSAFQLQRAAESS